MLGYGYASPHALPRDARRKPPHLTAVRAALDCSETGTSAADAKIERARGARGRDVRVHAEQCRATWSLDLMLRRCWVLVANKPLLDAEWHLLPGIQPQHLLDNLSIELHAKRKLKPRDEPKHSIAEKLRV